MYVRLSPLSVFQVANLKGRLESKTRRLEAATFDRDAIRAEYQVSYIRIEHREQESTTTTTTTVATPTPINYRREQQPKHTSTGAVMSA